MPVSVPVSVPVLRRHLAALVAALLLPVLAATPALATTAATAAVQVTNTGFSPKTLTVPYGTRVVWTMKQGAHTVTDSTKLNLFSSGPKAQGTQYAVSFINSGTFPYRSTVGPAISGTVVVPMTVKPATGNRTRLYAVRWGSDFSRSGYGEEVQIKPPGATAWQSFVFGTPASNATMRPSDWSNRTGVYQFRAKLFRGTNHSLASGWSPIASITVS